MGQGGQCARSGCLNPLPESAHPSRKYCSSICSKRARGWRRRHRRTSPDGDDFTCWVIPARRTRLTPFPCGLWHPSRKVAEGHVLLLRRRYGSLAESKVIRELPAEWEKGEEPAQPIGRRQSVHNYNHSAKRQAAVRRYLAKRRAKRLGTTSLPPSLLLIDALDEEIEVTDRFPETVLETG